MDQWIQNFSNKQFLFQSGGAIDTFTNGPLQESSEHEANKGCVEGDHGCDASMFMNSSEVAPTNSPKFSLQYQATTGWDNTTSKNINVRVKDFMVFASNISDTGFTLQPGNCHSSFLPSMTLGGKSYNEVQIIQVDTSIKTFGVYKIYFEHNAGLVAYEEYPSHLLWIRQ